MSGKRLLVSKTAALLTVAVLLVGTLVPAAVFAAPIQDLSIAVLATSDLHGSIMGWDYFGKKPGTGLTRIATLVAQERAKYPNNILVDAGDEIQGTPLVYNYNAIDKSWMTDPNKTHPMVAAFNYLKYDALVLGNHEFNFGLNVLGAVIDKAAGVNIPYLSANTLDAKATAKDPVTGDQPVWNKVKPYTVKTFKDPEGQTFKVGILGLTTSAIPNWESPQNYEGLKFADVITQGSKWVKYLKDSEKADAIVAVIHSGLGDDNPGDDNPANENVVLAFANANPDVNAIVAGHQHSVVNAQIGINKIWTVEPKNAGANLEEIVLNFTKDNNGKWIFDPAKTTAQSLAATTAVAEDSGLVALAKPYHDTALNYMQTKIGTATGEFSANGQTIKDTALMDFVNKVQMYYGGADLSAAAPFSPTAHIPKGEVTIGDISSVYIYENFLYTITVTGAQLRKYLEFSVGRYYKQYQPGDPGVMVNKDPVSGKPIPDYNLDLLQGAAYTVDLTKKGLYDAAGKEITNGEPRITSLRVNGQDVKDTDVFKLAINNYRYNGGGGFLAAAGIVPQTTDPNKPNYVLYDSQKKLGDDGQVRSLMIQYFKDVAAGKVPGVSSVDPIDDNNWQLYPRYYDLVEFTDTHGNIDTQVKYDSKDPKKEINKTSAALMAGLVNAERYKFGDERTVLLSGGDMMQGTPVSNVLRGKPVIDIMNQMGFEAMELGNHEFDWGADILDQRLKDAKFPFLAANIAQKAGDTDAQSAQLLRDLKPYAIIKDKDGLNIGVIGVITPDTANIVLASIVGHFDFQDPATVINKLVPEVKAAGADLVIVLAHVGDNGGAYDYKNPPVRVPVTGELKDLASKVTGVSAILGGHSHTINYDKVNGIPVAVGNASGRGAAAIRLALDSANRIIDAVPVYLNIYDSLFTALAPVAEVQSIVDAANAQLGPIFDEVIGTAAQDLPKVSDAEMALGDWMADVTRLAVPGVDFGFQNEGGVRVAIPKGPISVGTVFKVMPFDNEIVTMDLTGADILALLEQGVSGYKGLLQVSGLKFTYDPAQPAYHRVVSASALDGTPIDPAKTYKIATNDFIAGGQDGYATFKKGRNFVNTHILVRDAMINDLKARKTLSGVLDGRVKTAAAPVAAYGSAKVEVTASALNLRVGPGLEYAVTGSLPRGTVLDLVTNAGGWDKILYNGSTYFVYGRYVRPASVPLKSVKVTTTAGLNVRAEASLAGRKLGALPYGVSTQVYALTGDWYRIWYDGGYAYIYAKYTE